MKRAIVFFQNNIKTISLSIFCGLIISTVLSTTAFFAECDQIRGEVLRLHILANSDTEFDQNLKLDVRDRLLSEGEKLFGGFYSVTAAKQSVSEHLSALTQAAKEEVAACGYDYTVKITLAHCYFDTRVYENITLPAGVYEAVKVTIGEGAGKNWWCVMFPPMCVSAAGDKAEISDVLNDQQTDVVENGQKYKIKFKAVEIYEDIASRLSRIF